MEVVRHNGILEEAYLWREAFPFEEGVAHGFTGGGGIPSSLLPGDV